MGGFLVFFDLGCVGFSSGGLLFVVWGLGGFGRKKCVIYD